MRRLPSSLSRLDLRSVDGPHQTRPRRITNWRLVLLSSVILADANSPRNQNPPASIFSPAPVGSLKVFGAQDLPFCLV